MSFGRDIAPSRRILLACLSLIGLSGVPRPAAPAGPPSWTGQQAPVFTGRTDLVRISVAVIDEKTGRPVTGLRETDFSITENGVPQRLSTFSAESVMAAPPRGTDPGAHTTAAPDRRVFLLVVGRGRTEGPVHPLEGAVSFLREKLLPDDLASVMAFDRVTPFTTDHERLAQVVERLRSRTDAILAALADDSARTRGRQEFAPTIQADIDSVFQPLGSPRSVVDLLLGVSALDTSDGSSRPWKNIVVSTDLLKVYAGIEYLRHIEGSKQLICLTPEGFAPPPVKIAGGPVGAWLDSRQDDELLAARANDAGVSLDIIHTFGVAPAQAFGISASQNVAELTGGRFAGVRRAADELADIDATTRSRYLLGYAPANPVLDGTYRDLVIRVKRSGVSVLYPHGYTARPDVPPIGLQDLLTRARLRDAAASAEAATDIKVHAAASLAPDAHDGQQIRVDLIIDASRLSLVPAGATMDGSIDLMILCGDKKQRILGTMSQHMVLSLDDNHYQQAMALGIPYTAMVSVRGTPAFVKVVVYDDRADLLGTAEVTGIK